MELMLRFIHQTPTYGLFHLVRCDKNNEGQTDERRGSVRKR